MTNTYEKEVENAVFTSRSFRVCEESLNFSFSLGKRWGGQLVAMLQGFENKFSKKKLWREHYVQIRICLQWTH